MKKLFILILLLLNIPSFSKLNTGVKFLGNIGIGKIEKEKYDYNFSGTMEVFKHFNIDDNIFINFGGGVEVGKGFLINNKDSKNPIFIYPSINFEAGAKIIDDLKMSGELKLGYINYIKENYALKYKFKVLAATNVIYRNIWVSQLGISYPLNINLSTGLKVDF